MTEVLLDRLYEELTKFRMLCGSVNDMPDYIVNYSVCTAGYRVSMNYEGLTKFY